MYNKFFKNKLFTTGLLFSAFFFTQASEAKVIDAPEKDTDGYFEISWDLDPSKYQCSQLYLHTISDDGYDNQVEVGSQQDSYTFRNLPEDKYTISLRGQCQALDTKEKTLTEDLFIDSAEVVIGLSKNKATSLVPQANNYALNAFAPQMSNSSNDNCRTGCPSGQHSTFMGCYANCSGSCNPINYVECESNGNVYSTCDLICAYTHDQTAISDEHDLVNCGSAERYVRTCQIKKPGRPTIRSGSSTTDGNYTLRWDSVSSATRYEWKHSGISWRSASTSLSATATNIQVGRTNFEVRACNYSGCGTSRSRWVNVGPFQPTINLPSNNSTGEINLLWSGQQGAQYYQWRENYGNWQYSSGTSVTLNRQDGTYTYQVRACTNSRGCSTEASATTTVQVLAPISNVRYQKPREGLVNVTLYNSDQGTNVWYVHNFDKHSNSRTFYWNKPSSAKTRLQFKVVNGKSGRTRNNPDYDWTTRDLFDASVTQHWLQVLPGPVFDDFYSNRFRLPFQGYRPGSDEYILIYYRIRTEMPNGQVGDWQYFKPISLMDSD